VLIRNGIGSTKYIYQVLPEYILYDSTPVAGSGNHLTHMWQPTAYIIGRSASKFSLILSELQTFRAEEKFIFIEAQLTLLKEANRICGIIKERQGDKSIDVLFLTVGYLSLLKAPIENDIL